jgi:endonuclease/exonuclease/phosphatase family metal-dependent hydrolase
VRYTFDPARAEPPFVPRPPARVLARADPAALRVLTYNVEHDGLLDPELRPVFARLLAAVGPDLIGFQEVYAHGAEPVREAVASALPAGTWHAAKVGLDLVAVSRFPIEKAVCVASCDDFGSTGAFLIDTRESLGRRLLFVVAHPPCCTGGDPPADRERQRVIDATMAFLRDVAVPSSPVAVEAGTPVIVAGDMNLVGDRRQLRTVLTGDLADDDRLGPDFAPDWDGTDLADLRPLHTHAPMAYTWVRERGPFGPGRLDYVIYTDSVLRAVSGFVLHTPEMPAAALAAAGLQAGDTPRASDHLPVVGDFVGR